MESADDEPGNYCHGPVVDDCDAGVHVYRCDGDVGIHAVTIGDALETCPEEGGRCTLEHEEEEEGDTVEFQNDGDDVNHHSLR